jgi:hypothetical protein
MNVVTAADSNIFHCLKELAKSVRQFYDKPIILYDIGLTDEQKKQIDAVIIPIKIPEKANWKGTSLLAPSGIPSSRNTFKPFCVKHYFKNFSEPMILADADCLFRERVELDGFDVGVTIEPKKISRKDMYHGMVNSGVMFFNCPAEELVDRWAKECMAETTTDQKAISDILSEQIKWKDYRKIQQWNGLKIKILNARVYNDFHLTRKGKILHFINTRHDKDIYQKLIVGLKQNKNIRKMFRWLKRGKKSHLDRIFENIANLLKLN